jgi:hypothetical protein
MSKSFDPEKEQILADEMSDLMNQINSPETRREIYQRQGADGRFTVEFKYSTRNQTSVTADLKFPALKQTVLKFAPRKKA